MFDTTLFSVAGTNAWILLKVITKENFSRKDFVLLLTEELRVIVIKTSMYLFHVAVRNNTSRIKETQEMPHKEI